jgi:archaemetzincin
MNTDRRRTVLANVSAGLLVAGAIASGVSGTLAPDSAFEYVLRLGVPLIATALVAAGVAWRHPRAKWVGAGAAVALSAVGGVAAYEFFVPTAFTEVDDSELPVAFQRLVPLHARLAQPKPDQWLAENSEVGQTYRAYVARKPVRPDDARRVIYVQPLGEFQTEERRVLHLTAEFLGHVYQMNVRVRDDLPWSLVPDRARRKVLDDGTPQFFPERLLHEVLKPRLPPDAAAMITITTADLYSLLGRASLVDRVGVWSIYRLGDPAEGGEVFLRMLRRTLRIAAHETGHMFSLDHCIFYQCCMNGSNHLGELDRYPLWLCPHCQAKVAYATGADPAKQLGDLAAFADANGLAAEAAFWRKSLAAMKEK